MAAQGRLPLPDESPAGFSRVAVLGDGSFGVVSLERRDVDDTLWALKYVRLPIWVRVAPPGTRSLRVSCKRACGVASPNAGRVTRMPACASGAAVPQAAQTPLHCSHGGPSRAGASPACCRHALFFACSVARRRCLRSSPPLAPPAAGRKRCRHRRLGSTHASHLQRPPLSRTRGQPPATVRTS